MVIASAALLGGGLYLLLVPVALTPVASSEVDSGGLWQIQLTSNSLVQVLPVVVNVTWGNPQSICRGPINYGCPSVFRPNVVLVDCGPAPCVDGARYPVLLSTYAEFGSAEFDGRLGHWYGVEVNPQANTTTAGGGPTVPIRWAEYTTVLGGALGLSATAAGAVALVYSAWFNRETRRPPASAR